MRVSIQQKLLYTHYVPFAGGEMVSKGTGPWFSIACEVHSTAWHRASTCKTVAIINIIS